MKKKRGVLSDSEEEEGVDPSPKKRAKITDSDHEGEELEEEQAKAEDKTEQSQEEPQTSAIVDAGDSEDEGIREDGGGGRDFVNDFELMLARKKEEKGKRRKRNDIDLINDNDDLIAQLLQQMRQAAEEDRQLNKENRPATKKNCDPQTCHVAAHKKGPSASVSRAQRVERADRLVGTATQQVVALSPNPRINFEASVGFPLHREIVPKTIGYR